MTTDLQPEIQDGDVLEPQTEYVENEIVASVLEKYGDFEYTDIKSLEMLEKVGLTPEVRKTQITKSKQIGKYTGEWVESSRHGKGKLVYP